MGREQLKRKYIMLPDRWTLWSCWGTRKLMRSTSKTTASIRHGLGWRKTSCRVVQKPDRGCDDAFVYFRDCRGAVPWWDAPLQRLLCTRPTVLLALTLLARQAAIQAQGTWHHPCHAPSVAGSFMGLTKSFSWPDTWSLTQGKNPTSALSVLTVLMSPVILQDIFALCIVPVLILCLPSLFCPLWAPAQVTRVFTIHHHHCECKCTWSAASWFAPWLLSEG